MSTKVPTFLLNLMSVPSWPHNLKVGPEALECVKFANELRGLSLEGRLQGCWLHIPNEGKRSRLQGFLLKAMGLLPGASDFLIFSGNGSYALEFKAKGKKQTDYQGWFEEWCLSQGVSYAVVRSSSEALAILKTWGVLI